MYRALTRDCRARHKREDMNDTVSHPPRNQLGALGATWEEGYLGLALRRFNVKLFGAPWCEKCKQQKQMLYRMMGSTRWQEHYSDCGAAKCCLGCAGIGQVPLWKVNGQRYAGRFDVEQLGGIVGAQRPNRRGGRRATAARAAAASASGDVLGGLKLGEIPIGGRRRRHLRRGGWAKRAAVRVALGQNKGKYWCEFGELMTPRLAAAFAGQERAAAAAGDVGVGDVSGGVEARGLASTSLNRTTPGGYKKAGWIAPDESRPPPMGSITRALWSLSLRLH